ncbi:MAG TPA: peptidoglycan DD-metalloendopeptidase family protein [Dehalococcoidia bacterium]|nr:peptidoglycan DD-metalloendopeptidase family protein [Dehalococcoidia bacterium]
MAEARAGYLKPSTLISTVPSLFARHEAEVAATTASPAPETDAPTEAAVAAADAPRAAYFTYTIQPGDSMATIAANFGISESTLLWNNPEVSADPDLLYVGATLLIPSINGIVYNVALGDTLNGIASYYGVTVDDIIGYGPNGVQSPDALIDGMVLVIPNAVPPATPAPAPTAAPEPDPGPLPASGGGSGGGVDDSGSQPPPASGVVVPSSGYIWPFYGPISTYFGEPRGASYHKGIDIDGFGAYGAPIGAAASGTVVLATWDDWGLGYHVIIDHGDGTRTLYAHLSEIWVAQGQWVNQGDSVGALGSTGYSTGPHLHFELWIGGIPVDPLGYLY